MKNSENSRIHFYGDTFGEKGKGSLRSPKCPILRSDASFQLVGERSELFKKNKVLATGRIIPARWRAKRAYRGDIK